MNDPMPTHLVPAAERQLALPTNERLHAIMADRFVAHERHAVFVDECHDLYRAPPMLRPGVLMFWGGCGAGKTVLATRMLHAPPRPGVPVTAIPLIPILGIDFRNLDAAEEFRTRMLGALGCPDPGLTRPAGRFDMMLDLLRFAGTRLLVIDNFHGILNLPLREIRRTLASILQLMDAARVPLVLLARPDAVAALRREPDLAARLTQRHLPSWKADQYLANYLAALASTLPLQKPSNLTSAAVMRALVTDSRGSLGIITDRVKAAAVMAVKNGSERVTADLILEARQSMLRVRDGS